MSQHKLKGIIFDFNGVIIDDYLLQKEAWSNISQIIRGGPVTDEEMVHKIRGIPTKETIEWMSDSRLDRAHIEKLARRKTTITKELFADSPLLQLAPGLSEFLDTLAKQKIARTIATSQTPEAFSYLFDKLHLERWFNKNLTVTHDGTYAGKPAPDAYIKAAQLLGLYPSECIVVEDAQSGIRSAYAAGVRYIIAIGRTEQLRELHRLPGVAKAIRTFSELQVEEFFP